MRPADIFKRASVTYYYSSIFFPKKIREKVFDLYAFVRSADDLVDKIPVSSKKFTSFVKETEQAFDGKPGSNSVIGNFVKLSKNNNFKKEWTDAFLDSMKADLTKKKYNSFSDLEEYTYGSAEVIGLMMSSLLGLNRKAYKYARLQGKVMQLINFIRDIDEDTFLKRQYIPQDDLKKFGLLNLKPENKSEKKAFVKLVRFEINRCFKLQKEAEKGYKYIPYRYLIPIKTAADLYLWTAKKIYENPLVVWEKKIKPSKFFVVLMVIKNFVWL